MRWWCQKVVKHTTSKISKKWKYFNTSKASKLGFLFLCSNWSRELALVLEVCDHVVVFGTHCRHTLVFSLQVLHLLKHNWTHFIFLSLIVLNLMLVFVFFRSFHSWTLITTDSLPRYSLNIRAPASGASTPIYLSVSLDPTSVHMSCSPILLTWFDMLHDKSIDRMMLMLWWCFRHWSRWLQDRTNTCSERLVQRSIHPFVCWRPAGYKRPLYTGSVSVAVSLHLPLERTDCR